MSEANRRSDQAADRRTVARGGRRTHDQGGRYPRLVVADSHEDVRAVYVRFLDRFGFQTEPAATAEEALALMRGARPGVVLIEERLLNLPPWNLAHRPEMKGVPLIVLSGAVPVDSAGDDDVQPAAILYKPFALASMLETVRDALRPA